MTTSPRILLKLSGEAFSDEKASFSSARFNALVDELLPALKKNIELAIVVGGGNILRGATSESPFLGRVTADHMGMLGTNLNGLALRDALEARGLLVELMSALPISGVIASFDYRVAKQALDQKKIVIFAGGTGNPFITTDSTASLRAIEIGARVVLKATKVDGVFNKDPHRFPDATRYSTLSFDEVLEKELAVMDLASFCQCRDYGVSVRIFNLFKKGALTRALLGEAEGTLVSNG